MFVHSEAQKYLNVMMLAQKIKHFAFLFDNQVF